MPIVRRELGIGLLEIDSTEPHAFGQDDAELLSTIARVLSGPVELAGHHAWERRSNALREAFVGVISHELRTPITTIYGLAKTLRQRGDRLAPEVRAKAMEDVEDEADRLYRLVEDLLVLSRAEGGRVDMAAEPISLARLLQKALDAESERLRGRRFEREIEADLPLVIGEPTYVEQVVRNLLTNAAKYSQPPSSIRLVAATEGEEVVVRVLDEGIGIGEQDTRQIFDLFYRAPNAARTAAGAGIGLFVCRHLIEAMNGRIWARPRQPAGSEFGFALPASRLDDDGDI